MLFPTLCTCYTALALRLSRKQALHLRGYGPVRSQMRAARKSAPRGACFAHHVKQQQQCCRESVAFLSNQFIAIIPVFLGFQELRYNFGSKRAVCCMYGVVVLLSKPLFIVIVAVVYVVIAVAYAL